LKKRKSMNKDVKMISLVKCNRRREEEEEGGESKPAREGRKKNR